MPTEAEAFVGFLILELGMSVTDLVELYRDDPEAARLLRGTVEANMIEDAYRRLGDLVHLIRPKREAAA
jgi:hypothetical protein